MAIRIGPRLTIAEQAARKPENRGRQLAVEFYALRGGILRANETVGRPAQKIQALTLRIEGMRKIDLGIKLIEIATGEFVFQGVKGVSLKGFRIAETELTNSQFGKLLELKPEELARIVENPQGRLEKSLSAVDPDYKGEAEDCPMVFLSQKESAGIAELLGIRLLTELEWERAAAGQTGRAYSFGDQFGNNKATFDGRGTRSVHAHRDAATPEGVLDLSGNVWEWTSSNWGNIDLTNPKNPKLPQSGEYKVLRGGSWFSINRAVLRVAYRGDLHPGSQVSEIGVRFAEDI